jgi:predicted nucleic acid-binding protein
MSSQIIFLIILGLIVIGIILAITRKHTIELPEISDHSDLTIIKPKTLRKQLDELYEKKQAACKTKNPLKKQRCLYTGLWQKIKAKQKSNK